MTTNQFNGNAAVTDRRVAGSGLTALALTLAAGMLVAAPAASAPAPHPRHHPVAAQSAKPESVAHRIDSLHAALKITTSEEAGWQRVADIMRRNDAVMRGMKADPELGAAAHPNAVSDLKTYEKFNQAHVNGLAELIPAFATLYATMPHEQQVLADSVFRKFGRGDVKMHG